jgi:predicted ATPase/class 3 adenylate cyclase
MGTVTLLFTDVEGSTELLERLGAQQYADVLARHRQVLRRVFERHGGYEVDEEGDALFVVFPGAGEAVTAAGEGQRDLASADWPQGVDLRVRMGIHTGEPLPVPPKYVGMDVHRAARIMSAAHGRQVIVSEATAALLGGARLRDLGPHRLKDLLEPIRLFQLDVDGLPGEFPPLRSLQRTNLPTAAWPLVGRDTELEQIRGLTARGVRLLTLTGPGGSGKTRLALQAAAEHSEEFVDGVFFVALAPLRETGEVLGTVAQAVGLRSDDDVATWLSPRRVLLVVDNLEHLPGVAHVVSQLLVGQTVVLATSRAPLHLSGEHELPVEPLAEDAAVELFVSRAAAAGRPVTADEVVAAVCRRLDNLPLALELAAARVKLLAPAALLQRLEEALPLLTGGAHDLPERQKTLRTTIEWSHDLLGPDAQAVFRRLAVFRRSFTLEAAEAVAGGDLERVETLLDQSLLKPRADDRFFLLETIREYAGERLELSGETGEYASRHAYYFLEQLEQRERMILGSQRGALLLWFGEEEDNLRATLDRLEDAAPEDAARAVTLLYSFWAPRGQLGEAKQRIRRILAQGAVGAGARAPLLAVLAECEMRLGALDAAAEIADEALGIAREARDATTAASALNIIAMIAVDRGDMREAERLLRRALEERGDEWTRALILGGLGSVQVATNREEEARSTLSRARDGFRASGDEANDASCAINLAELELLDGNFQVAAEIVAPVVEWTRKVGDRYRGVGAHAVLGLAVLGQGRHRDAKTALAEALDLVLKAERSASSAFPYVIAGIALACDSATAASAARLLGAAARINREAGFALSPRQVQQQQRLARPLVAALGAEAWAREEVVGEALSLEETIALAQALTAGLGSTDHSRTVN